MTIEPDLASLAATDRPVPDGLRERLESRLVARAWASTDATPAELEGIDGPIAVPAAVRARLQGRVSATAKGALTDADAARPLPAALRARLERAMVPALRRRALATKALSAAAAIVLIASSTVAVLRARPEGPLSRPPAEQVAGPTGLGAGGTLVPGAITSVSPPLAGAPAFVDGQATGGGIGPAVSSLGPAPPFAYGAASTSSGSAPLPVQTARPVANGADVRVAIIDGDAEQVAGFKAYLGLLNGAGGIGGSRKVTTTPIDDPHEAKEVMAVVDLSPTGATTPQDKLLAPLLETLATPGGVLTGDVFSMASPPERQAQVAVRALVPARADGESAVIYHTDEQVYATTIADAYQSALQAQGMRVFRVEVRDDRPMVPVPADVAMLSMGPGAAREWLRDADAADYRPARGIGTIFPLADQGLARAMPDGTVIASPYSLDAPAGEVEALEKGAAREASARSIHGWVTAKALAVALWRTRADEASEVAGALRGLAGWDLSFMPAFELREGTNARVPDAVVYQVKGGKLVRRGGWQRLQ